MNFKFIQEVKDKVKPTHMQISGQGQFVGQSD